MCASVHVYVRVCVCLCVCICVLYVCVWVCARVCSKATNMEQFHPPVELRYVFRMDESGSVTCVVRVSLSQ